jgi:uncharacterized protein involved in type VI secretion and phage assembly
VNLYEILAQTENREEARSRIYGIVIGVVTNNQDPDGLGRVKVKYPWLIEDDESNWARIASPMAGAKRGLVVIPEVNDEVLIAFDHGDVRCPYVLGALWNGIDTPPEEKEGDDENNIRLFKSRSNHLLKFDDTDGAEKIEIIDSTGKNKIIIDSSKNKLTLEVKGDIELKAPDGKITLNADSLELKSSKATKIEAGSSMNVQAQKTMTIIGKTKVDINPPK